MTIKEIEQMIEEGNSLKTIAQAYSEIANQKIKRIRGEVERNRIFFQEISQVYGLIKELALKKKIYLPKNKKRISLIITSNYRFYGKINSDLIDFFVKNTRSLDTEILVLGKAAIDYFKANRHFSSYHQILLKADQPGAAELNQLVSIIKDYNQVLVFYSRLKSLLVQVPTVTDITATTENIPGAKNLGDKFIFEPELQKVLSFFDSQVLTLLLEQTFLESEVARTASRFISMDQAETEANKFIKQHISLRAYQLRNLKNSQILESIAAVKAART